MTAIPVQETETRFAEAYKLQRKEWKADQVLTERYGFVNRDCGPVYDTSVRHWMRKKGMKVPEPRSLFKKEWLFNKQFFNYFEETKPIWNNKAFRLASKKLKDHYSDINGLSMAEYDDVAMNILLDPDKKKASSGLPLMVSKKDALESDIGLAKALASGRVAPPPNVGYHRTQEDKVRLVWGYPLSMILLEGRFMLPIDQALRAGEYPYLLGYDSSGIQARLAGLAYSPIQYCLDWSKFDSTVPARAIHEVFDVIQSWFKQVDPTIWSMIKRYFITCPILMPDNFIYSGRRHGIPSGSWFTQIVGSMVNEFLVNYIASITNNEVLDEVYMGDDSVLSMTKMPNVIEWSKVASTMGMTIHPSKQVLTHGKPHFLQHTWGDAWPHRPVTDTINRLVTSEKFKYFKDTDESTAKEKYFQWTIDKAKSLMVDSSDAIPVMTEFIAWRFRTTVSAVRMRMNSGDLITGTSLRRGIAEADSTIEVQRSYIGHKRTIGEQQFSH